MAERAKGEPRRLPTYRQAIARCRHNGWRVTETLRTARGYRINYVTSGSKRRPGTIKARV